MADPPTEDNIMLSLSQEEQDQFHVRVALKRRHLRLSFLSRERDIDGRMMMMMEELRLLTPSFLLSLGCSEKADHGAHEGPGSRSSLARVHHGDVEQWEKDGRDRICSDRFAWE